MNSTDTTAQEINAARLSRINDVLKPFLQGLPKTVRAAYAAALMSLAWKQESEGVLSAESLADAMQSFDSPEAMLAHSKPEKKKVPMGPELAAKLAEVNAAMKPVMDTLSKEQRKVYGGAITSLAWRMLDEHCLSTETLQEHVGSVTNVDELNALYKIPGHELTEEQKASAERVRVVLKAVMKSLTVAVKDTHAGTITKIAWGLEKGGELTEENLREEIAGLTVEAAA